MFTAALAFATSLFWGGNQKIQDYMLNHLRHQGGPAFLAVFAEKVRLSVLSVRDWRSEHAFVSTAVPALSPEVLEVRDRCRWVRAVLRKPIVFVMNSP